MLTKLSIKNFKRFGEVEIELGSPVVFVGPNNSGKTTALQALSLWHAGLQRWNRKNGGRAILNRLDLFSAPVPVSDMLWRNRVARREDNGEFLPIEIALTGSSWAFGLLFHFENEESLACHPSGIDASLSPEASSVKMAFLPAMSGLTDREFLKQPAEINFLLGQGRTGEVLRNLCFRAVGAGVWDGIASAIVRLFGAHLAEPVLMPDHGDIAMTYREAGPSEFDLACSGRGLQQTLLLLTYLALNPASVLLLDEPDAHLEILRQRQIYRELSEAAELTGSQIIVATHSEVILNEAAGRDTVVAFLGKPHRIDDRGSQVLKALKEIGFEQYYAAEQIGWVLYLEGSTDLAILQEFARLLNHPAQQDLDRPFFHYAGNQPQKARDHFRALREAKPDLVGIFICDRLDRALQPTAPLDELMWRRREIENYLCQPDTLLAFAGEGDRETMRGCIERLVPPVALENLNDQWWRETKATDAFLDRLFEDFYSRRGLPNLMLKSNYHRLAAFVPVDLIDPEVVEVLDAIHRRAALAKPVI